MFDGLVTVYRNNFDVFIYVVGSARENELLLAVILSTYFETLSLLLRYDEKHRRFFDVLMAVRLAQEPSGEADNLGKL